VSKLFFLFSFFCIPLLSFSQNTSGLVARYYFNEGIAQNDLAASPVNASGIVFDEDRFGNASSSCYLNGNINSYVNLGTSDVLKPATGSISLWVKIGIPIDAGRGARWNPIILTKRVEGDDFFEAFAMSYVLNTGQVGACNTLDSIHQINIFSPQPLSLGKWHHLVMTYDDTELSLYIDAKLEGRANKNFHTSFLHGDSIMVGNSANFKNSRYLNGNVDDINIYNKVLTREEINNLYNESDPNRFHIIFKWALIILLITGLIWLTIKFFILRYKRELEKEKQKNLLQSQVYEMEMKVIKAQMNPHFIFNSMNSIQQFILAENAESANTYLVKFSRLLRKILESNTEEFISVDNEVDILDKYIEIESLRFKHTFSYEIIMDPRLAGSHIRIPQMLIQPFVENAIWHGLLPKTGDRRLTVSFEYIDQKLLSCTVTDNGIGRHLKQELKSKNKSLGIHFIEQRLALMKKLWGGDYYAVISDKTDSLGNCTGTEVHVVMPVKTI
jgi:hypothetical protein